MKTALDPRHLNRQKAVQDLFAYSFKQQKLTTDLAKDVVKNLKSVDELVVKSAPEFPLERINPTDLSILRLAIYELVFDRSQPPKVVIDEAVELAKEFGGETSPSFINGALGKVLRYPERVIKVIADHLGAEEAKITPEADFKKDLNATDIEIADLLLLLEKDLSLSFPKDQKIVTVKDILDFVEDD
jgi:N utilization substance protein B